MKAKTDPRHQKRREIVKILFAESFALQKTENETVKKILKDKDEIDNQIRNAAPEWPIENLNKVDLAILRLAVYELNSGSNPYKVTIDEAVELAKEFGSETSPSFINGVLGTIYNNKN